MLNNRNQPKEYDAVLGSQIATPSGAAVLGGLEAVKKRLASPTVQQKIMALSDTLKYGQPGLDLALQYLKKDESEEIRQAACDLLVDHTQTPKVIKALWTYKTGSLKILQAHSGAVTAITFSPDGKQLFSSGDLGNIIVLNWQQEQEINTLKKHFTWVSSLIFSLDGKNLISASYDHTISIWNCQTGEHICRLVEYPNEIPQIATNTNHPARIISIGISGDGQTLISGSQGKTITLWNLKNKEKIHSFNLNGHDNHISRIAISPNGKILASGGGFHDRTIKLWHLETGAEIRTLKPNPGGEITALAFTPDGETLVSSSYDKTVRVWNWQTGEEIHSLTGHKNWVTSVALSSDGNMIVSGDWDGMVKLWDLHTGEEISSLDEFCGSYANVIASVNISPDAKTIAIGDRSGRIKLWQV